MLQISKNYTRKTNDVWKQNEVRVYVSNAESNIKSLGISMYPISFSRNSKDTPN